MPITIEEAIARIPQWAGVSERAAAFLPGGITNSNYRVDVDGESFVVRIAGNDTALFGIDRQREYRCTVAANKSGVGPEVFVFLPDVEVLVTRFISGHSPSAAEMARPAMMARAVESMHRYHRGGAFQGTFSPFRVLEQYVRITRRYHAPLPPDVEQGHRRILEIEGALRGGALIRPCHNDLWGPNLIDDGARIRIVDWEYAGMGDVYFDLANFSVHHGLSDTQDEALLRGYFGEVRDGGFARLKLMKIVAELREALWYMVGVNVLRTDFDFLGAATFHFERYARALDDRRVPAWLGQATSA